MIGFPRMIMVPEWSMFFVIVIFIFCRAPVPAPFHDDCNVFVVLEGNGQFMFSVCVGRPERRY